MTPLEEDIVRDLKTACDKLGESLHYLDETMNFENRELDEIHEAIEKQQRQLSNFIDSLQEEFVKEDVKAPNNFHGVDNIKNFPDFVENMEY